MRSLFLILILYALAGNAQSQQWQWVDLLGTSFNSHQNHNSGSHCRVDRFGNLFLHSDNSKKCVISKYSTSGVKLWERQFQEMIIDLDVDNSGNVYLGGRHPRQQYSLDTTLTAAILIKYDPSGNLVWEKSYPCGLGSIMSLDQCGHDIVVCGYYSDSIKLDNFILKQKESGFICRINAQGNVVWAHSENGSTGIDHVACSVSGKIFTASNAAISVYDGHGTLHASIGVGNRSTGICVDDSANVYVNCVTSLWSTKSHPTLAKLDSNLKQMWGLRVGCEDTWPYDFRSRPVTGPDNNIYLAGTVGNFIGKLIFGDDTIGPFWNGGDFAITVVDSRKGKFKGAWHVSGPNEDRALALDLDRFGNIYAGGFFRETICFDTICLKAQSGASVIAKLRLSDNDFTEYAGIPEPEFKVQLGPNPTSDFLHVRSEKLMGQLTAELIDSNGKIFVLDTTQTTFDLREFQNGIYLLRLSTSSSITLAKVVLIK